MKYESTKTYGAENGLSCAFRQWRADSHCRFIHGYSLAFRFVFGCETLDAKGWVVDFGGLKGLKEDLKNDFDHILAIAGDDPELALFKDLHTRGVANVMFYPDGVGCEKFAKRAWSLANMRIQEMNRKEAIAGLGVNRLHVVSAECMEHAGNSAIFYGGL
jgi:6-pyruvoyltetrahydropterin/6-carboxytetrahydropterin synthase